MKFTRIHTLSKDDRRAILDNTSPKWRTVHFDEYGHDRHRFIDPTIQWSPAMAALRARYFKSMHPRADKRMLPWAPKHKRLK